MRQVPEKYKKKVEIKTDILPIYIGVVDINTYKRGIYGFKGGWRNVFTGIAAFGEIGVEWKRSTRLNPPPSTSQILKRRDHTSYMFWNTWLGNFQKILKMEDEKYGTIDFFISRPENSFSTKKYVEEYMNNFYMPIHALSKKDEGLRFLGSLLSIVEGEVIKEGKYNKNPLHPQHHFAVPKSRWHDPTPECNFNKVNKWKYFIRMLKKYMEILNSYTD